MCLITRNDDPYIAEDNINCYKIYMCISEDQYLSPYQKAKMPTIKVKTTTELDINTYYVEKGFHSFINIEDARDKCAEFNNELFSLDYYVFKCIIPKGARYYIGHYGDILSFCSESIIVEELLSNLTSKT